MALDSKIYYSYLNALASATLTSLYGAESNYPVHNVLNTVRGKPCRHDMSVRTLTRFLATWSDDQEANMFVMQNHNCPDDVTVQVRLFSDDAYTTEVYNSGALPVYQTIPWGEMIAGVDSWGGAYDEQTNLNNIFTLAFDQVTFKSVKINVQRTNPYPNDIFSCDKLWLGWGWTPSHNIDQGSRFGIEDTSIHQAMTNGGQRTDVYPALRTMINDFKYISNEDRAVLSRIATVVGKAGDLAIIADPNAEGYERLVSGGIFKRQNDLNYSQVLGNSNNLSLKWRES